MAGKSGGEGRNAHVTKSSSGGWKVKPAGAKRAVTVKPTQAAAEKAAKAYVRKAGGGEVRIHGRDGRIRDSDTVRPGNDPRSVRDTKH
ncbi:MAG: hypothetical protein QOC78_1802 [Solirubrobacteraceae bacterium]|jgi:hypothetical protein|nr:hypothetical protein [Solirubrobacteraceae bacterium]